MNVTLVIRTLNEEVNIGSCLQAIVNQSKQPDEILVVDNRSTDNTLGAVKTFISKLPIKIIDNPIKGFASGLELGVELSKHDHVAFLSADVVPEATWLEDLSNFMSESNCAVVSGYEKPYPENEINYVLSVEGPRPVEPTRIKFFNNTNTLYNKSVLKQFMPFKGVGEYLYGEDSLMSLDYASKGYQAYVLPTIVSHAMFTSIEEFKHRIYQHAKSTVNLFLTKPSQPRLYLNPFFWILRELYISISRRDIRFLRVAYWRLIYSLQGVAMGWTDVIKHQFKPTHTQSDIHKEV